MFDEEANNIISSDLLKIVHPTLDGMSFNQPWTYNGGHGLAGTHFEDGMLHFGHHMVDLAFTIASNQLVTSAVVNAFQTYSQKTWVFYNELGVTGAVGLNKVIGELWKVPSKDILVDELLVSRNYVLDPRYFVDNPAFTIAYQKDGDFMFGNAGHSVLGCGFVSFACNFVMPGSIQYYIMAEKLMSDAARATFGKYGARRQLLTPNVPLRMFTFVSALIYYYMKKGGEVSKEIKDWVLLCVQSDKARPHLHNVGTLKDDRDASPENDNDAQCEACGISYVSAKYEVMSGKWKGNGLCCECVAAFGISGSKLANVPVFPTSVAKALGLYK